VLLVQNVFYPYAPAVSQPMRAALQQAVARARAARLPIKVALIATRLDLGAVPALYGTPQRYASFLEQEITYNETPWLIVVMPQGLGFAGVPRASSPSSHTTVPAGANGLAAAAIRAIVAIAARAGHAIAAPQVQSGGGTGGGIGLAVGGGAALVIVGAGVVTIVARRRRSA
jgi:hypothetical protein